MSRFHRRLSIGLVGLALASLNGAVLAQDAAPQAVPVVRFAIDQDYFPEKQTPGRVAEDFDLMRQLSVTILRTGIGWDDTNPQDGKFNWRFWREVAGRAQSAGVQLRPYYAYTPEWAGKAYNKPPESEAAFGEACGVMARTLGAEAPSIEVWNEPDNDAFWAGSAKAYAKLFYACANAVRAEQPKTRIVLGGLAYLDPEWLDASGAQAGDDYDVAAFHQYSETPWDSGSVEGASSAKSYWPSYDLLSNKGAVPVWMNEGGASTSPAQGYSEATQADWIRRTVASLLGQPGRPIALFGLYQLRDLDPRLADPIGDPTAQEFFLHTGVFTVDGKPKLGAATYADLVRLFDGHRPAVQSDVTYQASTGQTSRLFRLYAWRLETGRQVIMIWDRRGSSSGAIKLQIAGKRAFEHLADGQVREVEAFDGQTLPVDKVKAGDMPRLFEVR